jgi:hypothetical protein
MSPVIAHNYKESSYPVGLFEWTLENLDGQSPRTLSLLFSFENGVGDGIPRAGGANRLFVGPANIVGIAMQCAVCGEGERKRERERERTGRRERGVSKEGEENERETQR